ncbi:MAG: UDP-N-acetylmuramoyl-L-alanyl-D-glutamate--2,6-diaminopimelate ligase [Pedobacter sp.]|nr:MAG: UDP-N-acetylmuramoyl-L-alanyl-D-glutamate--2,6-diaminopimelate ligase [Pedobacter sp.]
MQLQEVIYGLKIISRSGLVQLPVSGIAYDSRKVQAGYLFVAIVGTQSDGHDFIEKAISLGASVIVCETLPTQIQDNISYLQVENSGEALGILACNYFGNPSKDLKLVGITGTNGKTTIATLLFQLFTQLGNKVGLISTVQNQIIDTIVPSTHTTPDPLMLNELLVQMVDAGCEYVFMEVSSHAVVQHRITGLSFTGAVFSNITHDHLDFHKTFDAYLKAKKKFFDDLPKTAFALVNLDDKNGKVMLQNTNAHQKTYALKQMADYQAKVLDNAFSGLQLLIDHLEVYFKMIGSFNAYNLLAVYATALLLEQDKMKVLTVLSSLKGAEGRFDYRVSASGVIGIVDYAHTPDAIQNVLNTIGDIRKGTEKVITVIGCGGDRDKSKRPVMASVACDWSDKVILTSDNPRTEDPAEIIKNMEAGVSPSNQKKCISIVDRKEAIKTACHLAQSGDILLIAGKGHEKYQEIMGQRQHFDDMEILLDQFNLMN